MTGTLLLLLPSLLACKQEAPPAAFVRDLGSGFEAVAAGGDFTCALDDDGAVSCWGADDQGQVSGAPTESGFLQITAGADFACVRASDGALTCWGANDDGQSTPVGAAVLSVSAGADHGCAVQADGPANCWGSTAEGATIPPNDRYDAVAAGDGYSCAISRGGELRCWGLQASDPSADVLDPPGGDEWVTLDAGLRMACAVDGDGGLSCWGDDGDDYPDDGLDDSELWADVSIGIGEEPELCGMLRDGGGFCAGLDAEGEVLPAGIVQVSAGGAHGCALSDSGQLYCWPFGDDTSAADGPS